MPPSDGKYDPGVDGNLAGDPLDWSWPVPRHCRPSPLPSQGQQVQRERIIKDCVWNSTNITSILYKSNHALHQVPNKQKNFFWEISPKFVYPPQGFCEIWENERWNPGRKRQFSGQFGGFWGVWTMFGNQPTHPPTFGSNLPKITFFLLGAPLRYSEQFLSIYNPLTFISTVRYSKNSPRQIFRFSLRPARSADLDTAVRRLLTLHVASPLTE